MPRIDDIISNVIGRRVSVYPGFFGVIEKYEPLSSGRCDTLIAFDSGGEKRWYSSDSDNIRFEDTRERLPNRSAIIHEAYRECAAQLCEIARKWQNNPTGIVDRLMKRIVDGAIRDLEKKGY